MKLTNNTSICYWISWSALDATSSVIYEWTAAFTSQRKLSQKLNYSWGVDFRQTWDPKAVWKGSYFRQSSSKRETWGWVRELFFRCIASISTILLSCWWSLSIASEAFSLGQESTWHVSVTSGSSLLATGRCCQSVMSGLKLGRAHCLMELKRLHEVSSRK